MTDPVLIWGLWGGVFSGMTALAIWAERADARAFRERVQAHDDKERRLKLERWNMLEADDG
jgi:hypothetical protein